MLCDFSVKLKRDINKLKQQAHKNMKKVCQMVEHEIQKPQALMSMSFANPDILQSFDIKPSRKTASQSLSTLEDCPKVIQPAVCYEAFTSLESKVVPRTSKSIETFADKRKSAPTQIKPRISQNSDVNIQVNSVDLQKVKKVFTARQDENLPTETEPSTAKQLPSFYNESSHLSLDINESQIEVKQRNKSIGVQVSSRIL